VLRVAAGLGAQPRLAFQPVKIWIAVAQETSVARSAATPRIPVSQLCAEAPGGAPAGSVLEAVDVPSSEDPQPAARRAAATSARASDAAAIELVERLARPIGRASLSSAAQSAAAPDACVGFARPSRAKCSAGG